eukprot:TRINITY_DN41617_c0_g1_i1.p1 TRINITY_DN41617_c0_g1~~TRINITY_DN41617_c0_g1_i1.p1  ORF type:complete len:177 (-),score=15.74 TRINITY_DN41617_c0_g1_i1:434-964(-)
MDREAHMKMAAQKVRYIFGCCNAGFLHVRMMRTYFQWAWTARHTTPPSGYNYIAMIMDRRPWHWWEMQKFNWKVFDFHQKQENWRRRRRGIPRAPWERGLCDSVGVQWRDVVDRSSSATWADIAAQAIAKMRSVWKLSVPREDRVKPDPTAARDSVRRDRQDEEEKTLSHRRIHHL